MSTFKKCQVVMLPTEKASSIHANPKKLVKWHMDIIPTNKDCVNQHLYILSDEKPKISDWCIQKGVWLCKITCNRDLSQSNLKKIIATTNKSLTIDIIPSSGFKSGVGALSHKQTINLPQPSQSFIEKYVEEYNKGNIIIEVMVEYEAMNTTIVNRTYNEFEPKINPKDNTITIRKVKDNWTREEVKNLCFKAFLNHKLTSDKKWKQEDIDNALAPFNKWIEENL